MLGTWPPCSDIWLVWWQCSRPGGGLHGNPTYRMSDVGGQVANTPAVSAGVGYPGEGPAHALGKDVGRVNYGAANDKAVRDAGR